jgi:hypothetical protein
MLVSLHMATVMCPRSRVKSRLTFALVLSTPLAALACGGLAVDGETTGVSSDELGRSAYGTCGSIENAWSNYAIPESTADTGPFTVQFQAYPHSQGGGPPTIDGVLGLSDGQADAFTRLGPIVRFNPNGGIDARDGAAYVGNFPYRDGVGPFEFQMLIDISTHRYSVWVRHLDAINKPFEVLGTDLAFRSEQAGVTRLDNLGGFVEAPGYADMPCHFSYSSAASCRTSAEGAWETHAFAAHSGVFRIELLATPSTDTLDAVVGAASGSPDAFSDLAAIVRFRPDGLLDARNGKSYSAENTFRYRPNITYWIALDIDQPNGTYSATAVGPSFYDPPTVIAQDYAFRTEQAGIGSFDHIGQYVDGTDGTIQTCGTTVVR